MKLHNLLALSCVLVVVLFASPTWQRVRVKIKLSQEFPVVNSPFLIETQLRGRKRRGIIEYRWMKNGLEIKSARGKSLRIASFKDTDLGSYKVSIINRERGSALENFYNSWSDERVVAYKVPATNVRKMQYEQSDAEFNCILGQDYEMHLEKEDESTKANLFFNGRPVSDADLARYGIIKNDEVYSTIFQFKSISRQVSGLWKAVAGEEQFYMKINVYRKPDYIEIGTIIREVRPGGIGEHHCVMENIQGAVAQDIQWFYRSINSQPSELRPLSGWSVDRSSKSAYSQFIRKTDVSASDTGYYTCRITSRRTGKVYESTGLMFVKGDFGGRSGAAYSMTLTFQEAISWRSYNRTVVLVATIVPPPKVPYSAMKWVWYKDNILIDRRFYSGNKLTIDRFTHWWWGTYKAVVSWQENGQTVNLDSSLLVRFDFSTLIIYRTSTTVFSEIYTWQIVTGGSRRTVVCDAPGYQRGQAVAWYFNDVRMDAGYMRLYKLTAQDNNLYFTDVNLQHEGVYRCVIGGYTGYFRLVVYYITENYWLYNSITYQVIRSGGSIRINCKSLQFDESPFGRPQWYVENKRNVPSQYQVSYSGARGNIATIFVPSILQDMILECHYGNLITKTFIKVEQVCRAGYRRCTDGQCLPAAQFCDGRRQCRDGSDEDVRICRQCDPIVKTCQSYRGVRPVKSNYMVHWVCDGEDDCGNNYDERDCSAVAYSSCDFRNFRCRDGSIIPNSFRCDDENDCRGGSDEQGCRRVQIQGQNAGSNRLVKTVYVGGSVTFRATGFGVPLPRMIWRWNWRCLPESSRFSVVQSHATSCQSTTTTLTISNIQLTDSGIYTAEALAGGSRVFSHEYFLQVRAR